MRRWPPVTLTEVTSAIKDDQPKLRAQEDGGNIVVEGKFLVHDTTDAPDPAKPITEFEVRIVLPHDFPRREPSVYETAKRIPRISDRHVNPTGTCCITVWEHWLVTAPRHSFTDFLKGPLYEYFLGQYLFEKEGKWPFGERPHGADGLVEAYSDTLGIEHSRSSLISHLQLLSRGIPKGHWPCPCGSGRILRECHLSEMRALHEKVLPASAKRMLEQLHQQHTGEPTSSASTTNLE